MIRTLALAALCMSALQVVCAQPMFVQAEDFQCDGAAWVVADQASRYAPDSGLKHLAGASGGQGTATMDLDIPQAGRYRIWVRHSVGRTGMAGARGPFLVTVRSGDQTVGEGRFDEQPPEQSPTQVHGYVWGSFDADLPAGGVRIELSKLEPLTCSGYTRYVDCLVLTTDLDYQPDVSDFQPKVWLRVRLGPTQTTPIYIHCFADHFRAPWYMHFSLSADGFERRVAPSRGAAALLTAGQATPWCDITQAVYEDRGARLELRGAEKYSYTEWLPSLDATFDFATGPSDDAIVKSFHREGPGAGLVVMVPGVLSAETADRLRCDADYVADLRKLAEGIPAAGFGARPERFPFSLGMGLRPGLFAPDIREAEYRVAAQMGFDGSSDRPDEMMRALGFTFSRAHTGSWFMDENCYLRPQTDRIRERIAAAAEEWGEESPTLVMFMDEPTGRPLEHAASCDRCRE
ncbi:MAG TPA: hypothetical protein VM283_03790, partial [Armatimonadota bacterium]|nr:hypothetical protein [Armatimonadota bacterium]